MTKMMHEKEVIKVSILVLVDVGLRRSEIKWESLNGRVSILVLVDVGLRQYEEITFRRKDFKFQSLF